MASAATPLPQKILWVGAHQDDIEALTAGPAIRRHLELGYDCYVLWLTRGINSGVRPQFPELDDDEFEAARDDESIRCARRLGVRFDHIYAGWPHDIEAERPADSALAADDPTRPLTPALAASLIDSAMWSLGGSEQVWLKTHTYRSFEGYHPDHLACGLGARQLLIDGYLLPNTLRFYVPPYQLPAFRAANPGLYLGADRPTGLTVVQAALDQYKLHDGVAGCFGIGYASVKTAFDQVRAELTSYYHVP